MSKPILTVVIPAYNAENHIARCLDSLLTGPTHALELIVVDDGSEDATAAIASSYASKFPFFRLISQSNRGLSGARNTGLQLVSSKFGLFLDSDDEIDIAGIVQGLIPRATKDNLDVLMFDTTPFSHETGNGEIVAEYSSYYHRATDAGLEKLLGHDLLNRLVETRSYVPSAWLYLWRTEYLLKSGIRFIEGKIHEDNAFSCHLFAQTENIAYERRTVHRRLIRSDSLSLASSPIRALDGYMAAFSEVATLRRDPAFSHKPWVAQVESNLRRHVERLAHDVSAAELMQLAGGARGEGGPSATSGVSQGVSMGRAR
jgi:glycosyltransferase involved in cell wall biosynthesis